MIQTNKTEDDIQELVSIHTENIANLPQVPEGDVKKQYAVGCNTAEDWDYIHNTLITDGTTEISVPEGCCECIDDCKHTAVVGKYMLTPEEAEELSKHPKVKYVHIDYNAYQGTYKPPVHELITVATKKPRYNSTRKHYRDMVTSLPFSPASNDSGRSGYQLLRCGVSTDPWWNLGSYNTKGATVIVNSHEQYGDGSDIDVIVTDTAAWYGHPEFINIAKQSTASNDSYNSTGSGPRDYRGGNVLPGDGYCDVLDLCLDAPYYLDPDFFNADPANRLITRWDGTLVPNETYGRGWWNNNSLAYRSSKFVSPANGGTATGSNDFGTIYVQSSYTRANNNGSNTARNLNPSSESHATHCMGCCYGRSYGWAYNANKWHLNNIGYNEVSIENSFHMVKVFHRVKPINPALGTKDPTLTSNSWGYRSTEHRDNITNNYYFYRHAGGSTGTVTPSGSYTSTANMPYFMTEVGYWGDGGRMKGEMTPNSMLTAGESMIDAGVIMVVAAGNSNQKQVQPNHPDFDNFWSKNVATTSLQANTHLEFGVSCYNTTNRPGFPQQLGRHTNGGTVVLNKVINVGALDKAYQTTGHERKVSYSDMGNGIDLYAPADDTLSCTSETTGNGVHPDTYTGLTQTAYDNDFSGTSAACPVAAGLIATKLQYNRNWTWSDIKTWLGTLTLQDSAKFYFGSEAGANPNDSIWLDELSLHGSTPLVIYDEVTGNEPDGAMTAESSSYAIDELDSVTITVYTLNVPTGTYYYSIENSQGDSGITAAAFDTNSLTGSFSYTNGGANPQITLNTTISAVTSGSVSFRLAIRTGSTSGTIVAMTDDISITGTPEPVPFVFASGGVRFSGVRITFQ